MFNIYILYFYNFKNNIFIIFDKGFYNQMERIENKQILMKSKV